jgi:hypothetical protein
MTLMPVASMVMLAPPTNPVAGAALARIAASRASLPGEQARIKELERELRRKEAALAETAALLVLRKKAVALWGEEGGDT